MGPRKFHPLLFNLLCKGIMFRYLPSVASNHIFLFTLQICVGCFKFNDLLSLRLRQYLEFRILAIYADLAALFSCCFLNNASACESKNID
jgi:hypothetical protein